MILVTGATGHLGFVLIKELLKQGNKEIRAVVLPNDETDILDNLDIEVFRGDICDYESLLPAFKNVDTVYHLAGKVSIKDYDPELKKVNLDGTKNVIKACLTKGVKKLIYTSTVHVFVPERFQVVNESTSIVVDKLKGEYSKTKASATLEVRKAKDKGLKTVIIYPSGLLGPLDYRISPMTKMIIDHLKGNLVCSVEGSYDFVDVRDAARGIIKAAQSEKSDEYILSGVDISIEDIFKILDSIKKPFFKSFNLPLWVARMGIPFTFSYSKVTGCQNILTKYALDTLSSKTKFSNKKAKKELNFKVRPVERTIYDTFQWFKEHGLI
ncbi:MAG: NAD-dependent epimerase/dehydratase family protein [Bacillota bacterium]